MLRRVITNRSFLSRSFTGQAQAVRLLSGVSTGYLQTSPHNTGSFMKNIHNHRYYHSTSISQSEEEEDVPALSSVLAQQIVEEDVEEEFDQELLDAQQLVEKHFTVDDKEGVALVTLTRKFDDEVITVKFDCQNEDEDYNGMEESFEQDDGDVPEDEEEENKQLTGINFQVNIERNGNQLEVACFAGNSFEIRNVKHISSELNKTDDDSLDIYSGPKFEDLDPDLQSAFYDFLAERNIDEDLSFYVQTYSQDKEQREYIRWLKKCLEFSAK